MAPIGSGAMGSDSGSSTDPAPPDSTGTGDPTSDADAVQARIPIATRISKPEYENSVLDVLGVQLTDEELNAATGGIPDDHGDGVFKRFGDKQTSVEQHATAYFDTADAIATRVSADVLSGFASCTDSTPTCVEGWTAVAGRRLFRRSLDARELQAFANVFSAALTEGEDFTTAARWTLRALLQAPQFLFRLEDETTGTPDQDRPLSGTELAARLASFVWISVPDEPLLEAAESGALLQPAELDAQLSRMLTDPKAQRLTETFVRDFSRAQLASFDGATETLRDALTESVIATFQYHLWDAGRSIAELFTTTEFVVNAEVAELLGLEQPVAGLQRVDVGHLPERMGILTHPGSIAGMGDRAVGSFVNRGKYLMERLLCTHPVAVPAGLLTELENFNRDTTGLNEHERAAIRMTRPECWGCHTQFEPLAFGFSRFDGAGRYIGETDAEGKPLPLDGWVPVSSQADSPNYTSIAEYMQVLSSNERIQDCMTEHFISFATSHETDALAKREAPLVGAQYRAAGSSLTGMVSAVAQSHLFQHLRVLPVSQVQEQP